MAYEPSSGRDQNDLIRMIQRMWESEHPGDTARKDWQASLAVAAAHEISFDEDSLQVARRMASLYPLWDMPLSSDFERRYSARFNQGPEQDRIVPLIVESGLVPHPPEERVSKLVLAVLDWVAERMGSEPISAADPEMMNVIAKVSLLIQPIESRLHPEAR